MLRKEFQPQTESATANSAAFTFIVGSILVCLPFIQLGYQYYVSTMILVFALIAGLLRPRDAVSSTPLLVLVLTLMLLPSLFYLGSRNTPHNILLAGREFICFSLIYIFLVRAKYVASRGRPNMAIVNGGLFLLTIGLLCFVIIQHVFLLRGIAIYIPADYYILGSETIPTELALRWSHVRPSASFAEPSYLGFIASSLLAIILHVIKSKKTRLFLAACLVASVLFAHTLAGILSCSVLLLYFSWTTTHKLETRVFLILISFLVVSIVALSGSMDISKRITNLTNKNVELSGYYRIIVPLKAAGTVMQISPLGIPSAELPSFFGGTNSISNVELTGPTANGFLNLIINYGITGILIMFLLIRATGKNRFLVAYLFFASMFNGGILAFDKAAVISLVILLISVSQRTEAKKEALQRPPNNKINSRTRNNKNSTITQILVNRPNH